MSPEEKLAKAVIETAILDLSKPSRVKRPTEAAATILNFYSAKNFLINLRNTHWGEIVEDILNIPKIEAAAREFPDPKKNEGGVKWEAEV